MSFIQTDVKYFRPNKTLEFYQQIETGRKFSIYNYEGIHFRLFQNESEKDSFFENGIEPRLEFDSEGKLDKYLEKYY